MQPPTEVIVFVHKGTPPDYLLLALQQARISNPTTPVYLLIDTPHKAVEKLGVPQVALAELESAKHEEFLKKYYHVSSNPEGFEKFCFSRWFYINEFMKGKGLQRVLCVDSDCMIFAPVAEVFEKFGKGKAIAICDTGSPHCALVEGDMSGILDYILAAFAPEKKAGHLARMQASTKSDPWVLSDMFVLKDFVAEGRGSFYGYDTHPEAVITAIMSDATGFEVWGGKRILKRVYWQVESGVLLPYLKRVADGRLMRAAGLHYKGGAKRRMRSFNKPNAFLPAGVRAWLYNNLSPFAWVQLG